MSKPLNHVLPEWLRPMAWLLEKELEVIASKGMQVSHQLLLVKTSRFGANGHGGRKTSPRVVAGETENRNG